MKVTGELFSFQKREKEPKGQDATSIKTFRPKDRYRTELWSCKTGTFFFYIPALHAREKVKCVPVLQKEHFFDSLSCSFCSTGQFLSFRKTHTEFTKNPFPNFYRKNLLGKKTEQESNIIIIFLLCLF
jgi:hypothetical protein